MITIDPLIAILIVGIVFFVGTFAGVILSLHSLKQAGKLEAGG